MKCLHLLVKEQENQEMKEEPITQQEFFMIILENTNKQSWNIKNFYKFAELSEMYMVKH